MMEYLTQVIAILPVPAEPPRNRDEHLPATAMYGARPLGYRVRAPSARPEPVIYEKRSL